MINTHGDYRKQIDKIMGITSRKEPVIVDTTKVELAKLKKELKKEKRLSRRLGQEIRNIP